MEENEKRFELRGAGKERFLGSLAGILIRIYGWFIRVEVIDRAGIGQGDLAHGTLYVFWHNRICFLGPAWRKIHPVRKTVVLTSASKDGAILAAVMRKFGVGTVRGSSSRRSRAAMVGLMRKVREGYDVGVTPDGPRGPRYHLQPGAVKLAQACGVPIVPVRIEYGRAWRLNTWDRFRIAKPFSRVTVIFEPALAVARDLSDDEFEAQRRRIESVLRAGVDDLPPDDNDQD